MGALVSRTRDWFLSNFALKDVFATSISASLPVMISLVLVCGCGRVELVFFFLLALLPFVLPHIKTHSLTAGEKCIKIDFVCLFCE